MRYSFFGALLGCTMLLPVATMAADPATTPPPSTQAQPPAPGQPGSSEIKVQQPAPQIHVTQPPPSVAVRQPAPEIIVRQPPPVVSVQIPQPEIIVRMPKPEVSVATPPPQVAISESKPQVQVEAAKPQVNVAGQQQAANVQMQQTRPNVRFEQTGQPQVTVSRGEGQPQVRYEETGVTGQPASASPGAPHGDDSFATKAAQDGMAEVAMANMAEQKASSPQVKQFAQVLANDHAQINKDLEKIAHETNVTIPAQPSSGDEAEAQKLRNLSGADFDQAFVQNQIAGHQKDIAEFEREAQSGSNEALKAFAQKTLPVLQQHLKMAQSLSKEAQNRQQ